MQKKTKRQLSKIVLYFACFILLYFILPAFFFWKFHFSVIKLISIFVLPHLLVIFILLRINVYQVSSLVSETQKLQEKINLVDDELRKKNSLHSAFSLKIERYKSLKVLVEQINSQLDPEHVAKSLLASVFELIAHRKGNCILYIVDIVRHRLNLYVTKKEDEGLVIKAKEGDIFDHWVLRHNSSLLVEDARKDFRFDLDKIKKEYSRPIQSLISAPLVSQEKVLGIIRLDNPRAEIFSQDDLRFLDTISSLGAVALENAKLFKETQELAIKDSLTGCFTKGYFLERLGEELKRSMRSQSPLSLLMLDIDHFKEYNDKFGHIVGDIVLKQLSQYLRGFFQVHHGMVCRFGGEEFSVFLPSMNKAKAVELSDKLRQEIQNRDIVLRQKKTSITISIGLAVYPQDVRGEEELIQKADVALYQAKQQGRNRVCSI